MKNRRSKLQLAIENVDGATVVDGEQAPPAVDPVVDGAVEPAATEVDVLAGEIDLDETQIEGDSAEIVEGESIQASIDDYTDQVEEKVESGEGVSEEAAEFLDVAVEHFRARIKYKKEVVPATEGFAVSRTRLDNSKIALENLRAMSTHVSKGLSIAEEGLVARIGNAIKRAFTSADKAQSQMNKASTKFDAKESVEVTTFDDPAWGRVFARSGKKDVKATDVIAMLEEYKKLLKNEVIPTGREADQILTKAIRELTRSTWIANDAATSEIKRLTADSDKIKGMLDKSFNFTKTKEGSVKLESPTKAQKDKIVQIFNEINSDKTFTKVVDDLANASSQVFTTVANANQTRLRGSDAADLRAFSNLCRGAVDDVYDVVYAMSKIEFRLTYAVSKYIEASAK